MVNTKNNFIVYYKGRRTTIKIQEYSSMIDASSLVAEIKKNDKSGGYPFIACNNPQLVIRR
jgi:hypothetical protein